MATIPPTLGIAGVAGIANTAFPFVTQFDLEDLDSNGIAEVNGRLINPPFLFGAGGVEQAGKEMTQDLQALKAQAQANARPSKVLVPRPISSIRTRLLGPALLRILAASVISTIKVERPLERSSLAPMRVKT